MYRPAAHEQPPSDPGGDVLFLGHFEQPPDPTELLYVPLSHATQPPSIAPVYPALHTQSPMLLETSPEVL